MDVTRKNQEGAYQDLVALLPHCEFYALDLEMTGIRAPQKLLRRRELAVAAQKGLSVYPTVANNPTNATSVKQNPLLTHSQMQPPCESYDEKIVAASTFNVVQLGLSLFFKKGTQILAPVSVEPLGNAPAAAATATLTSIASAADVSGVVGTPIAAAPAPAAEASTSAKRGGAATAKSASGNNARAVPTVTLPLTKEGEELWHAVDAKFASSAAATTTAAEVTADALTFVTEFIAKTCEAIQTAAAAPAAAKMLAAGGDDDDDNDASLAMEDAAAVSDKMATLMAHTELFNKLTDAVQIRGLVEQFAIANNNFAAATAGTSSSSSNAAGVDAASEDSSCVKWVPFEELFTLVALDAGRLVAVPSSKGGSGGSSSGNAFGASKKSKSDAAAASSTNNDAAATTESSSAATTAAAEEYTIRAFSFYLFPHPHLDARDMTLNSTTVGDFLANQSPISFDKWVKAGVHYVSREKLMKIRNERAVRDFAVKSLCAVSKKNNSEGSEMAQLKESCPSLSSQELATLKAFMDKCNALSAGYTAAKKSAAAGAAVPLPDPLPMPFLKDEAFSVVKKLFVELGMEKVGKNAVISSRFAPKKAGAASAADNNDGNSKDANDSSGADAIVSSASAAATLSYTSRTNKLFAKWQEKAEFAGTAGTRVFDALVKSRKPVIVQNGWSDLAFLYTAFHHGGSGGMGGSGGVTPLDLKAFKTGITALFPTIYDSRTLATLERFNSFSNRGRLERMYQSFQQEYGKAVNVYVPEYGQEIFAPDEKTGAAAAHDASYDSFITGCLFLYERAALADVARIPADAVAAAGKKDSSVHAITDVKAFANIVPCYGSIFSLKLDDAENDVWMTMDAAAPVLRITLANEADFKKAPRSLYSGQTRVKSHLTKQALPGVVQVPKDSELLYFIDSTAKGLGSLLDFSISQALPFIEKDIGYKVKVELFPLQQALAVLQGLGVKAFPELYKKSTKQ